MSTVNYNDTTPAPPAGLTNIKWQSDASGNISAGVSGVQTATQVTADYTCTNTDTFVVMFSGGTTVYLPANPTPSQLITVRNGYLAPSIMVNGNGRNVQNQASVSLYQFATVTWQWDPGGPTWRLVAVNEPSGWMNWTPTMSASGSMTVSGLTINDAQWQWLNPYTVNFKFTIGFTLGGTASNTILVSLPVSQVIPAYPLACYSQSPGQGFAQDTFFGLMQGANFTVRNATNTNLALGIYNIYATGSYRIS